ncbi:TPA: hypothetical protein TUD09_000005 [Streptococcus equi subsp. zooepidemicus]|uniref:Conjugative transposon membrane protein n=1 Tax=Streptococcus equi subsp. ruminatorum CECT 5772 TaxID=1051981 RepID=A0A922T4T3_9STRE|nr:hypothetical protein [Streptococcus equi]KED03924.1 hypothetical protein CECT5772_07369 [Streptococcus equi subsp. ruminatorum CECT 5772]HEL0245829.1 hypothetical protein [Streptococcus equi subsp. zooepidemicus]HEL1010967.1 hypothetical protein [Streptococcus equi subsp. ruminatorum]HEL1022866.1 hypothetical protein [Streptococcus equi subsp. ruminatorum CECT 5772]
MNQSTLDQLTMSLKDYNPTAYNLMETVAGSMEKVAILLLLLFMGINLLNWHQQLKSNGGELSLQLWIEEILKYAIALFLILYVDEIFDSLSWLFNVIIKMVAKLGVKEVKTNVEFSVKNLNWAAKGILQVTYWVVDFIGQISTKLLILLRSFTLYTYKGIGKIVVACYMMESLRPICFGFFKLYIAAVLQGLILVIVIMLYPAIVTDDLLTVATKGAWISALMAIGKGIIYIIVLFGSQRMAKNIMQVN